MLSRWSPEKTKKDSIHHYDLLRKMIGCIPCARLRIVANCKNENIESSVHEYAALPVATAIKSVPRTKTPFYIFLLCDTKNTRPSGHVWSFPKSQSTRAHGSRFASPPFTEMAIMLNDVGLETK